jgi:hypothetical protein
MSQVNNVPEFGQFDYAAKLLGALKKLSGTTSGSTALATVAHGLGRTPKVVIPVAKTATDSAAVIGYVALNCESVDIGYDVTNVYLVSSANSTPYDLYIG